METRHDRLANCAGYHEGDRVWVYRPTRTKDKSPNLKSSWDSPLKVVSRINYVVYMIKHNPTSKMMVVQLDLLALFSGAARGVALRME
jgi:hypothetical protein